MTSLVWVIVVLACWLCLAFGFYLGVSYGAPAWHRWAREQQAERQRLEAARRKATP